MNVLLKTGTLTEATSTKYNFQYIYILLLFLFYIPASLAKAFYRYHQSPEGAG